jgi:hypothetical protein
MAKRWSAEDIRDLKTLAQKHSVQAIAAKMRPRLTSATEQSH